MCLIPIADIEPVHRAPGVPVFNDSIEEGISARERVERILRAFVANDALPPVELAKQAGRYPFRLKAGLHRLYCSIAAGFTEIPAVKALDLKRSMPDLISKSSAETAPRTANPAVRVQAEARPLSQVLSR